MFVGGPLGSGKQYLSWVHLEDVVRAIRYLIENEAARGVYNLTAPNPITNKGFGYTLGGVLKRPSSFPVPGFMLKLILGEMSTVLLDGQRVIPKRLLESGFQFRYPQVGEALKNIYGKGKTG
jgi:uncharacterized protein (TIGR01777 family)